MVSKEERNLIMSLKGQYEHVAMRLTESEQALQSKTDQYKFLMLVFSRLCQDVAPCQTCNPDGLTDKALGLKYMKILTDKARELAEAETQETPRIILPS